MQEEAKKLYRRDNGEWGLFPYLITCTNKGVQERKYADDAERSYCEAFEEMYSDFAINEVQVLAYTNEQFERLNDIHGLEYKDFEEIYEYVMNGTLMLDSKIFAVKLAERNRADIDYISIMTGVEL